MKKSTNCLGTLVLFNIFNMKKFSNFAHNVKSFSEIFTRPSYKIFKEIVEAMVRETEYSQSHLGVCSGKTLGQIQYFFAKAKWSFTKLNEYRLRFMRNKPNFRDRKSDYAVLDGTVTTKNKDSEFKGLVSAVYSNRDKRVVNGIKLFGGSVLTQDGVKYIVDFLLYIKTIWLSENQAWKAFAKKVATKTSAYLFLLDSGFKSPHIIKYIFHDLKRHFLLRIGKNQKCLVPSKETQKSSKKPRKFPDRISKKIASLCTENTAIQVQDGKLWFFSNVILSSWQQVFPQAVSVVVYHKNGFLSPIVLVTSLEIPEVQQALDLVQMYFKRWSIEQLFKEIKSWFSFEKFRVTSLRALGKFLHLVVFIHSLVSTLFFEIQKHKELLEIIRFVIRKSRNILELTVVSLKLFFQSLHSICFTRHPWLHKDKKLVLLDYFF